MEKILTVIVPSYNMEKYLSKNLESLIVEKPLFDLVDVIVVNDGSKDRTSEIAHGYAQRYLNSIRVIDKPNGNYGSCVNVGVRAARGKYVRVLDADDYVDGQLFSKFLAWLKGVDVDLALTDYETVNECGGLISRKSFSLPAGEFGITELGGDFTEGHSITYRTKNLLKIGYEQIEGISYSDLQWSTIPQLATRKISYFPQPVVKYLMGRAGQTMDVRYQSRNYWMSAKVVLAIARDYRRLAKCAAANACSRVEKLIALFSSWRYYDLVFRYKSSVARVDLLSFDEEMKGIDRKIYEMIEPMTLFTLRRLGIKVSLAHELRYHPTRSFFVFKVIRLYSMLGGFLVRRKAMARV